MFILCMQIVVYGKIVQVVLLLEWCMVWIDIVDDEIGSYLFCMMSIEQYVDVGMVDDEIVWYVFEVVMMLIEQFVRLQLFDCVVGI